MSVHSLRSRRSPGRRRRFRPLIVVAALVGTVVGLGWVALHSSLFAVRTVTVEGTSRLSAGQVLAVARVVRGGSLFGLDPTAVERRVARLPAVAHVEVRRRWPHGVNIRVVERTAVGAVASAGEFVLLDATGVAFDHAQVAPPGLVTVQLGAAVPGPGDSDARAAMQVLGSLPLGVRHRVLAVHAPSPLEVSLDLRDGRSVLWGSAAQSATKAAVLQTLLHRRAQVYDVSTPSIVVTR
ncbi:MAG: cell division protein FtsQ [Frankiaceae bacterium]|nr:cell division protein FtsQ [Frankiaceae bacterium]